jgi:putative toxin-antitoxin system antitoxin component (TIGR02293 family)
MASSPPNSPPAQAPFDDQVLSVTAHAGDVFGNLQKALRWLHAPHPALRGKTPLEVAGTAAGFQEVEDILGRIEYGVIG